jgi:predicted nucleic acid-binding Zn finger protein
MSKKMLPREVKRISDNTFSVGSDSSPTDYLVEKINGVWVCNCPHFVYRLAGRNEDCKHITAAKEAYPEEVENFFRCEPVKLKVLSEFL